MNFKTALSWLRRSQSFTKGLTEGNRFRGEGATFIKGSLSVVTGTGNLMVIGEGSRFSGRVSIRGSDNKVLIGRNCDFRGSIVIKGNRQTVSFGDHSSSVSIKILCQEGCNVSIGSWCMLSREIEIRTTDAHSVIDRGTLKRINKPESVIIGDHVWVGLRAIISKGVVVGDDSIVAAGAFVNKTFNEAGVIIAGSPAAIVKRGVTWSRSRKTEFAADEIDAWRP